MPLRPVFPQEVLNGEIPRIPRGVPACPGHSPSGAPDNGPVGREREQEGEEWESGLKAERGGEPGLLGWGSPCWRWGQALLGLGLSPSPSLSLCFCLPPSNLLPHGRPKLSIYS